MSQSPRDSAIEVLTGTIVGFVGSWLICLGVGYMCLSPVAAATWTAVLCTCWSLARGYAIRRHFAQTEKKP